MNNYMVVSANVACMACHKALPAIGSSWVCAAMMCGMQAAPLAICLFCVIVGPLSTKW
jgi:hypothetical protein